MSNFIGLNWKERIKLLFLSVWTGITILFLDDDIKTVIKIDERLDNIDARVKLSIAPSPDLVRTEVNKRPYEPFGVPGVTNSFDLEKDPDWEREKD